jgi:hypothetical protein
LPQIYNFAHWTMHINQIYATRQKIAADTTTFSQQRLWVGFFLGR